MSMIDLATRVQSLGLTLPALLVVIKATLILAIVRVLVLVVPRVLVLEDDPMGIALGAGVVRDAAPQPRRSSVKCLGTHDWPRTCDEPLSTTLPRSSESSFLGTDGCLSKL